MDTKREVVNFTQREMEEYLNNEDTRIVDIRVLELYADFRWAIQALDKKTDKIMEWEADHSQGFEVYRLYYRHTPRQHPLIHGLLD